MDRDQNGLPLKKGLVLLAFVAVVFGISDSMVSNWDHTMHMETIERSTPFNVAGWRNYGTGYYRMAAAAKLALEPIHGALRLFGFETLGLQASAIFVNLSMLFLFFISTQRYLSVANLPIFTIVLAFALSPIFIWVFRVYPDVALAGVLGVSLVLVLAYSVGRAGLIMLAAGGALYGLALHIKQPAILFAPCLGLLLSLTYKKPSGMALFAVATIVSFVAIGYPKEYQLVTWLMSYFLSENDWVSFYRAEVTLPWVRTFTRDAFLMAVVPSLPLLFSRSDVLSINALGAAKYYRLLAVLCLSVTLVFLAFLLQPVTVGTEHYMIIAMPIVAMIFLMLPVPGHLQRHAVLLVLVAFVLILYRQDWAYPIRVLSTKAEEIRCQSSWRNAESLIYAGDLRSPHIPFGLKKGPFFMAHGTLYDRLAGKEKVNFLVNSRLWLARFAREETRERAYQRAQFHLPRETWQSASGPVALERSFNLLDNMAAMDSGGARTVGDFRVSVIYDDPVCSVRVIELARLYPAMDDQ